jgi:FMN phosphatase YigB (HAD superfamily)
LLCSNCSRRVKPIVAFDIDGTLGDYHGHIHRFAAEYVSTSDNGAMSLLESLNNYDGTMPHSEWFYEHGIDLAEFRAIKLAYRHGSRSGVVAHNDAPVPQAG